MDDLSISHTKWNCTYHFVFIPKYRRKVMYGQLRKEIAVIIKNLCEMKQVILLDGAVCADHVHMYVALPPKLSVSDFMAYLKGKSTLQIFDAHPEMVARREQKHFWARGYYVETIGKVNEDTIRNYIDHQQKDDERLG